MKNFFMGMISKSIGALFSGLRIIIGKAFKCGCSALSNIGVGAQYTMCFMLFSVGTAGVFARNLPLNIMTAGLYAILAQIVGVTCLLLSGYTFARIIDKVSYIRAKELNEKAKENEVLQRKYETVSAERNKLKVEVERKNMQLKSKSVISVDYIEHVLNLEMLKTKVTFHDFSNVPPAEVETVWEGGIFGKFKHPEHYAYQYVGFRERQVELSFCVDMKALRFEELNKETILVRNVKVSPRKILPSNIENENCRSLSLVRRVHVTEVPSDSAEGFLAIEKDSGKYKKYKIDDDAKSPGFKFNDKCPMAEKQNQKMESILTTENGEQFAIYNKIMREYLTKVLRAWFGKDFVIGDKPCSPEELEKMPDLLKLCKEFNERNVKQICISEVMDFRKLLDDKKFSNETKVFLEDRLEGLIIESPLNDDRILEWGQSAVSMIDELALLRAHISDEDLRVVDFVCDCICAKMKDMNLALIDKETWDSSCQRAVSVVRSDTAVETKILKKKACGMTFRGKVIKKQEVEVEMPFAQ